MRIAPGVVVSQRYLLESELARLQAANTALSKGLPLDDDMLDTVTKLADALGGPLGEALAEHITSAEIAALHLRARTLLDNPVMPGPDRHRPIPWPAF